MQLKFKVSAMVHRTVVDGADAKDVVLVKLSPVGQAAGDILVCVEDPEVAYKPEEWLRDRDGAQVKRMIAANTVIQSTSGEANGKTITFVQDAEYLVNFTPAK